LASFLKRPATPKDVTGRGVFVTLGQTIEVGPRVNQPRPDAALGSREMLMMQDVGVVVTSGPLSPPRGRGPDLFPVPI
jgi:hypothetical protein